MLLCFIDLKVRKIRNEASSCPGIFSRTLCFNYVPSSSAPPLPFTDELRLCSDGVQFESFRPMMMIAYIILKTENIAVPLREGLFGLNRCEFELCVKKKEAVSVIILTSSSRLFR